jgi:hypothetical protein
MKSIKDLKNENLELLSKSREKLSKDCNMQEVLKGFEEYQDRIARGYSILIKEWREKK